MSGTHELAQATELLMRAPLDDVTMSSFVLAFDTVTRIARASPGFVWQLQSDDAGHLVVDASDPLRVLSLSTWVDYPSLHAFVYRGPHGRAVLRRGVWFAPVEQPATALWWVPAGTTPDPDAAFARLSYLRHHGPTARVFTVRRRFDPLGHPDPLPRGRRR